MTYDEFAIIARRYWRIRQSGDLSAARSDAHNDVIDALDALGIRYDDREHSAQLARDMLDDPALFDRLLRKKLTQAQWERLSCQFDMTPPLDDHSGSGQHMVLVSVLNGFGYNPRSREEAMALAEELLAAGDENSAPS